MKIKYKDMIRNRSMLEYDTLKAECNCGGQDNDHAEDCPAKEKR